MASLETCPARPLIAPDDQAVLEYRKRVVCIELYALAVLIGLGLSTVYLIGTLILKCITS